MVRVSKAVRKEGLKSPLDLAVGSVVTAGEFRKWEVGKQKLDGSGDERMTRDRGWPSLYEGSGSQRRTWGRGIFFK